MGGSGRPLVGVGAVGRGGAVRDLSPFWGNALLAGCAAGLNGDSLPFFGRPTPKIGAACLAKNTLLGVSPAAGRATARAGRGAAKLALIG